MGAFASKLAPSRSAGADHEGQASAAGALFSASAEDAFTRETWIFNLVAYFRLAVVRRRFEDVVVCYAVLWNRIDVLRKIGGTLGPDQADERGGFVLACVLDASQTNIAALRALGKVRRGRRFAPLSDRWWFAAPWITCL